MSNRKSLCAPLKPLFSLLLLSLAITCTSSARILDEDETPVPTTAPVTPGSVVTPAGPSAATSAAAVTNAYPHHPLIFFMHDILGGSNPSARAVTGIVANPAVTGQVAFAKPNGANLPVNNGVPLNNNNNGLVNNNNVPFLTGLSGTTAGVAQNNGNNFPNGGFANIPVLNGGQVPAGSTLQKLMFGTLTVIDDELTEDHELGSGLVGKYKGFMWQVLKMGQARPWLLQPCLRVVVMLIASASLESTEPLFQSLSLQSLVALVSMSMLRVMPLLRPFQLPISITLMEMCFDLEEVVLCMLLTLYKKFRASLGML